MTDDPCADHVGDELIFASIPRKQHGTRASPPVKLGKSHRLAGRNIELILRNAGRPQHADNIGLVGLAQTGEYLGRALAQITGASGDLELLRAAVREDFDLCADCRLVVGKAGEGETQRVVAVSADIVQHDGRSIQLRDDQVGGAIAVDIRRDDRARIVQLELVQAYLRRLRLQSPARRDCARRAVRGPFAVSTIAARSIQPSLSISIAVSPHAALAPESGSGTRSKLLPSTLRHRLMPGAPAWVTATSIHPSLLKSKTRMPRVAERFVSE